MQTTHDYIDASLYPDVEPPDSLPTLGDRVDYLARLCGAWDFGILPDAASVAQLRRLDWREAVDACRMLTSPGYHLLRRWHGLPELPFLGQRLASIADDPELQHV